MACDAPRFASRFLNAPRVFGESLEALGKLAELGDLSALEEALSRGDAAGASGLRP